MKVGDLVRANSPSSIHNTFNHRDKLIEIVNIEEGFIKRIRLKFHDRITMGGYPLHSWENAIEWEVDIQRMRDEKLKELGV